MRVQRREQPGAAGAEDQDVGLEPFEHGSPQAARTRKTMRRQRRRRECRRHQPLLPLAPGQVLDHQHADAAQHVHGQQEHEHRLGEP